MRPYRPSHGAPLLYHLALWPSGDSPLRSPALFAMSSSKSPALKKWIDQYMADNPLRAKSVVMTLFGDVITPHGGQVWLGSLIELLAPFGINDRLVRTSVFRLAEEGWLDAQREGRRSRYALNPSSIRRFDRAYQRIYTPSDRKSTRLNSSHG